MIPNSYKAVPELENTNLLHSSPSVEFFKLFITDDFVTKMAEQSKFYAVQRGAPRSFKPVSDGVIHFYLYINIRTTAVQNSALRFRNKSGRGRTDKH